MSRRLSNCLNYTGSKFRFINIINELLPQDSNLKFLDLFGGGGDITANSFYKDVTYNEKNKYVFDFLTCVRDKTFSYKMGFIFDIINLYQLSSTNKDGYDKLKAAFNNIQGTNERKTYLFYMLACHSNSNMIRFNKDGYFNVNFGQRTFNKDMRAKLRYASERFHAIKPTMLNKDFRDLNFDDYHVIYADPPYIGTDATYNECGAWTINDEVALQQKLINFGANGGLFMLSGQRLSKGVVNQQLLDFVKNNNLQMIDINSDYESCNYQRKNTGDTIEVIIKNY